MASAHDQQPVQALSTDGPHPSLRVGVGLWRPDRGHQHNAAFRVEYVVEAASELRVAVTEQEAHPSPSLFQHEEEVASRLRDPATVGVGGLPAHMAPTSV